ncbi:uncharacterized protein B0H18DRAFT_883790 [Fomitopsis serialis]|uniref:uncharacterized protein n=1 Tax=Fomitopsis serialis TaxID=139415 RepID=UPI002007E681|nr:uncharacterized protein B0H18DRAFT_883790 [Neoantrodia serialis]KAH9917479.1 hypothetical protein B0H18DRAFT_883790 [Neoantrodia serialis]
MRAGEAPSPILENLGGPSWLEGRERTEKTYQRPIKFCLRCYARDPIVRLYMCGKCTKVYYCSRECQKTDWFSHQELAARNERIQRLALTDPAAAQREKDWDAWRRAADVLPYVSALRLYQDPSRARTHLIIEESLYTPYAGTRARDKFGVVRCAVIRMSDFLNTMADAMGVRPGAVDRLRTEQPEWGVKFFIFRSAPGMTSIDKGHTSSSPRPQEHLTISLRRCYTEQQD